MTQIRIALVVPAWAALLSLSIVVSTVNGDASPYPLSLEDARHRILSTRPLAAPSDDGLLLRGQIPLSGAMRLAQGETGMSAAVIAPLHERVKFTTNIGDFLGWSVALSDETAIVGATEGGGPGSAYILERNQGGLDAWGEVARLVADAPTTNNDAFGLSVAISGDTAIVGDPFKFELSLPLSFAGAAYIFERDEGGVNNWGQVKKLAPSDASQSVFRFGNAVGVSGDTAIVGAPASGSNFSGAVYVFERNAGGAGNWGETARLVGSDPFQLDMFGEAAAISGDTLVVGAPFQDTFFPSGPFNNGAVYVFERGASDNLTGGWTEVAKLSASDPASFDGFGEAVAVSGDVLIAGAPLKFLDAGSLIAAGAVYVFDRGSGGEWTETRKLVAATPVAAMGLGASVAIDDALAVAGAPGNFNNSRDRAGSVHIFQRDDGGSGNWGELAEVAASDAAIGDGFGFSVALSGVRAVVGAPERDGPPGGQSGGVYILDSGSLTGPIFTPLVTIVRAVHVSDLRTEINALRVANSLSSSEWTDDPIVPGVTTIKAIHLTELRQSLAQMYVAQGLASPAYTDPSVGVGALIRAQHMTELRAAIVAIQ